jgi:hypothetical protein
MAAAIDAPQFASGEVFRLERRAHFEPREVRRHVALRKLRIGRVVVAGLPFPEAEFVALEQLDLTQPLEALVEVPLRHDRAQRSAVVDGASGCPSTSHTSKVSNCSASANGSDVSCRRVL